MTTQTVPDQRRAKFIAGLHEFADYLAANPWLPIDRNDSGYVGPARIQVDLHGEHEDATAETISRVREIATQLGVKVDEQENDRTSADVKIGAVSYSLIAWHKNGRPAQPDERDAELARLRAEVESLEARIARVDALPSMTGLDYSREAEPADDPTPVSPARGWHGGSLADETPDEAPTLWAAIRFSDTRREAGRLIGRTTPDLLRTATLDLLHEQALVEDADRARRADVREGEQGRITDPNLAHFFAKKEEARRQSAEPPVHMQFVSGDTSCGLTQGEYRDGCGTANQAAVTCKACIDGMPF